ncbi:MAG: universal stress protein, partial [Gammaproteobacteria bacterium]
MYSKILVAVDATDESRQVVEKAAYIKRQTGAAITLLHVVEPIAYAYGGDIPLDIGDIQKQIEDNARQQLAELNNRFELDADIEVTVGRPEAEIHRLAEEREVGLIVVG